MIKTIFINLALISNVLFAIDHASGEVPLWVADATWYQIFPERFYNGDEKNDPTVESLVGVWPWEEQKEWRVSPWTSDWYAFQPWEIANGQSFNYQFQIRRYGGDIQGIINKLDYLRDLGVTALYLNPVFDSPSSHKYGAAMYHHIDRHFGPNPEEDTRRMENEDPEDPHTWVWTTADSLFLVLVEEVHNRGMKIIIDGVFNHVGLTFWAFQDVISRRENSPYYSWFIIRGSGLEDLSHLNEMNPLPGYFLESGMDSLWYAGYVTDLPAFRQDSLGPVEPVRYHLKAIVSRWMDPNNDGDPSDGIDGWRLDVAERLQLNFWSLFGSWVRSINPDAYLTGEVWWEDYWNNKQYNAAPWLEEGRFDGVMNYRFADAVFKYFIDKKNRITTTVFDSLLAVVREEYPKESLYQLQNLLDSHDSERILSAIVNPDRWLDHGNNTWWNPEFDIRKPNAGEINTLKLILAFQFSYLGAPYIYYGGEAGMWGADDPDCRKPMLWEEFSYDSEVAHPCNYSDDCNYSRPIDMVEFNRDLFNYYRTLAHLRNDHRSLRRGDFSAINVNDNYRVFAFTRAYDDEKIVVIINNGGYRISIPKAGKMEYGQKYDILFTTSQTGDNKFLSPYSAGWYLLK